MWPFRCGPANTLQQKIKAANQALRKRDLEAAIPAYQEVLEADPDNLSALMNLGTAFYLDGQHTGAIERFSRALELDPRNATALMNLGAAHGSLGHLDRGIEALIEALKVAPMKRDIHYNLAALYMRKGETARAMAELELELALHPDHVLAQKAADALRRQELGSP